MRNEGPTTLGRADCSGRVVGAAGRDVPEPEPRPLHDDPYTMRTGTSAPRANREAVLPMTALLAPRPRLPIAISS